MGWFNTKLKYAWKFIFSLTEKSVREGGLPITNPTWREATNPWWSFLEDVPMLEEEHKLVWESLPQISQSPVLCSVNLLECLSERRMLERQPIATSIMGSKLVTKLIQVFQPTVIFNLHIASQEMEMGVL